MSPPYSGRASVSVVLFAAKVSWLVSWIWSTDAR